MRRPTILLVVISAVALVLGPVAPASADAPPSFPTPCPRYGDLRICSAQIPSFDGSLLDVDLTLPKSGTGSSHPLIVMLHGLGNNKHEWESTNDTADNADKWHWNSHWFATHGYYVLTYTARGFRDDGTSAPWQPNTPSFTSISQPFGRSHLKSRDAEIHDTQWLAAVAAYTFPDLDANEVAVTGGSYGGGESWTLASQATWDFPHDTNPQLPVLSLQVAVPKYPWTDLAYSLAPNGHGGGPSLNDIYESSTGTPDSDTGSGNPLGVAKLSYITGLYALANSKGQMEGGWSPAAAADEPPVSFAAWFERAIVTGDPYDAAGVDDPEVTLIRRGLTEVRSAYYQDEGWTNQRDNREVAIFSIQGWTDDLFTAVESFRMYKYLKRLDPNWPVSVAVADVGHSRAQNKPDTWHRLNNQAWNFLQNQISGSHTQQTTVYSEPTICAGSGQPNFTAAQQVTATTPEGLSKGTLSVAYAQSGSLTSESGTNDPNGLATDPVLAGLVPGVPKPDCRTSPGPSNGYTAVSQPLPSSSTYVGLGYVELPNYVFAGDTGTVLVRVWDVVPGGQTFLVTRGAYRIDVPYDSLTGTLRIPLFGNHWRLLTGHRIRLDIVQVDEGTFRRSSVASSLSFDAPTLVLPTRESGTQTVAGA